MLPRSRELLHEIVAAYIETGEPVASRSIARRRGDTLSAASVRNVMADLDEEGYLHQPHTSAGRIPTEKAFRSYVQSLTLRRMAAAEIERLRAEFGRLETVEQRVEYAITCLVGRYFERGEPFPIYVLVEVVARLERRIHLCRVDAEGSKRWLWRRGSNRGRLVGTAAGKQCHHE